MELILCGRGVRLREKVDTNKAFFNLQTGYSSVSVVFTTAQKLSLQNLSHLYLGLFCVIECQTVAFVFRVR